MIEKKPNFIIDAMLGNLAKKLRVLGYDSKYFSSIEDEKVIAIAENEKRIIVSKDEELTRIAEKKNISSVLIRGNDEIEQIAQIDLKVKFDKFSLNSDTSRCIECNGNLQQIEKYRVIGKVPEGVLQREERFWMCSSCKKVYWEGTHFEKLQEFVDRLNNRLQ